MDIEGYTYIAHKLIERPWGPECRFTVARLTDKSHINEVIAIPSVSVSQPDLIALVSARLAQMKAAEDYEALFSNVFDACGTEVKEALRWLVIKIRQNPNATAAQAETAWNAEFAVSLFTFTKLAEYVQNLAGGITWAQFKTFVINRKFRGID